MIPKKTPWIKANCLLLIFFLFILSSRSISQITNVIANFTSPDTVCVNTPVTVSNTSIGATNYFWNFCVADLNKAPTGLNLGNLNGGFSTPVYIDYVSEGGHYFGFLTNNVPGKLLRLDFGNSLLNIPSVTDLGSVGGIIPNNTEGVQVIKNENKWYVIIVGGAPEGGTQSAIVKIELGTNIGNNSPIGTYWGNIGNLDYPHDLHIFDDNGHWYGFTVNTGNNTITRFDFTTSFSNTPTAVNLGNIGNLNYPTGVNAINDNGSWYIFVTNARSSTLSRLDFGTSLLSTPVGNNLGNLNNQFRSCWDIQLMKFCGELIGYVINAEGGYQSLVKLDFKSNFSNIPSVTNLGNIGNLSFPHCLSKLFRTGADLYSFIPNVDNSTLTRIKFTGCTNSSIPNSTLQNPPAITYDIPGIYNINLSVDDGLATQTTYCKSVVVMSPIPHFPIQNISICEGDSIRVGASTKSANYVWNNGSNSDSFFITTSGLYWVKSENFRCSNMDSFNVTAVPKPVVQLGRDTTLCAGNSILLSTEQNNNYFYSWSPALSLTNPTSNTTIASPVITTKYVLTAKNQGCVGQDTIEVLVKPKPTFTIIPSIVNICKDSSILIKASGGNKYDWVSNGDLLNVTDSFITVRPSVNTNYYVIINDSMCNYTDTLNSIINITSNPVVTISKNNDINCAIPKVQLVATGGIDYKWFPVSNISNATIPNPLVYPQTDTWYRVQVRNSLGCMTEDSVQVLVNFSGSGSLYIPNAFTPNHDGKNDCFGVKHWGTADKFELSIYNRWGERVFYTKNTQDCWNGQYKGKQQPSGVFVYHINVLGNCGSTFKKGTVVLIR